MPPVARLPSDLGQCHSCQDVLPVQNLKSNSEGAHFCFQCFEYLYCQCRQCGKALARHNGEVVISDAGTILCSTCYDANFVVCDACNLELQPLDAYKHEGAYFCQDCNERRFFTCESCSEDFNRFTRLRIPGSIRKYFCVDCFSEQCVHCDSCGEVLWRDASRQVNGRTYCDACSQSCSEWGLGEFCPKNSTYELMGSTRKFGVELETSQCPNHTTLREKIIWECKHDCSIDGMEFVTPILWGDEGLQIIDDFCDDAKCLRFKVDRSCGYHAHFDIRNESEDGLKAIAYAYRKTYKLWNALVPSSRSDNRYCGTPDYTCEDICQEEFVDYFVGKRDRFEFVNWRAFLVHGSLEVRLYQGTLDAVEICNWVRLHARFIDFVSGLTFEQIDKMFGSSDHDVCTQFASLANIIGSELADYWIGKSQANGKCVRELVDEPIASQIPVLTTCSLYLNPSHIFHGL